MNIFNIIGPIMIGPSSSHTAGACRLGRVVNKVADGHKIVEVKITLSGSFARTYRGHGTDKALLAGIMGYYSWSEEIRNAIEIAEESGLDFEFIEKDLPSAHPNTALIDYVLEDGKKGFVMGASIGGGNIRVDSIDGLAVDFTGENSTLLVIHKDTPGVIANVTNLMYGKYSNLNIGNFKLSRKKKGGIALMTIELDDIPPVELISDIKSINNIENALMIRAI